MSAYEPMTLRPASRDQFRLELLACLTLVAPPGMTEELRAEWLEVARETLKDVPEDLLKNGCSEARLRAKFPSEIVPIIIETIGGAMRSRREYHREQYHVPRERHIEARNVEPRALQKILRETGHADIADKLAGRDAAKPVREQHQPTRAEYLALGIDEKDIPTWAK